MPDASSLTCSQCGLAAPADPDELRRWKHGELALSGEAAEGMLLCPSCDEEDAAHAYDEGAGD